MANSKSTDAIIEREIQGTTVKIKVDADTGMFSWSDGSGFAHAASEKLPDVINKIRAVLTRSMIRTNIIVTILDNGVPTVVRLLRRVANDRSSILAQDAHGKRMEPVDSNALLYQPFTADEATELVRLRKLKEEAHAAYEKYKDAKLIKTGKYSYQRAGDLVDETIKRLADEKAAAEIAAETPSNDVVGAH